MCFFILLRIGINLFILKTIKYIQLKSMSMVKISGTFDNKYINLVMVYLKHIQFISNITEIWPASFIYDLQICITLSLIIYVKSV